MFALSGWLIYYLATVENTLVHMLWLLKQFFYICLMNKGPQHLPRSQGLLHVSLVAYLITGVLSMLSVMSLELALPMMLVNLVVMLLYAWICLKAFNHLARFVQMTTAMAGVDAIFQFIAWPIMAYINTQQDVPAPGMSMLLFFIVGWNLAIYAHIFRESFNVRMLSAFVLTLAYVAITVTVRQLLFPDVGV